MNILTIDYTSKSFKEDFVSSLRNCGFAVIKNHPIDIKLINSIYSEWQFFFETDEKHDYLFDYEKQDGYFPFKSENAYNRDLKDLKEFYHIYPEWGRYPNNISSKTIQLFNELLFLGKELLKSINLFTPANIKNNYSMPLHHMIKDSQQNLMRVIHYPPLRTTDHPYEIRAAEHTDINLITLLVSGSQPGLQVKNKEGLWVDIESRKGQIVVNNGDMLQECSSGFFPSTFHRVVNPNIKNNKSRFSIPLFIHPKGSIKLSEKYSADSYLLERLKEIGLK